MPRKRGGKNKKVKSVLHVFCEGEKTEPNYLNGYLNFAHSSNRQLKIIKVEKTRKNTPVQLVDEAIALKKSNDTPGGDEFWVVYDREGKSKYSDDLHKKSLDKAGSKGINVALTNVCFEVWILLHFVDVSASYSSCSDLIKNSKLRKELEAIGVVNYEKSNAGLFDLISGSIDDAKARARKMNSHTLSTSYEKEENPHLLNPYTGVHLLLEAIDEFVKNSS